MPEKVITLKDFGVETPQPTRAGSLTVSFEAIAHMLGISTIGDIRTIEVDNTTQSIKIHIMGEKLTPKHEGVGCKDITVDKDGRYTQQGHSVIYRDPLTYTTTVPSDQRTVFGPYSSTGDVVYVGAPITLANWGLPTNQHAPSGAASGVSQVFREGNQ